MATLRPRLRVSGAEPRDDRPRARQKLLALSLERWREPGPELGGRPLDPEKHPPRPRTPERRRQGVYRRLHGDVIARARADAQVRLVRLYVDKDNERARATYLALGMELSRYDMMEECL